MESEFLSCQPPKLLPPDLPPPSTPQISLDRGLQVHLQICLIIASKCFMKLGWSRRPSVSANLNDSGRQVRTITASKCILKLTQSQPSIGSANLLDYGLPVHLQSRLITVLECISKLSWSRCSETVEVECRQPIINFQLYLACHPNRIVMK